MLLDIIFYLSWMYLLLGIFIFAREIIYKWSKWEELAIFGGFLVTMIIFIEAVLMVEEHKWRDDTIANKFTRWVFGEPPSSHWKWHVNPFTVPFSLLGRVVVLCASVFGDSAGKAIGRFFAELPAFAAVLMVPFTFLCIILGIFCVFGYQFDLGYGFLKVRSDNSRMRSLFTRPNVTPNTTRNQLPCISKIDYCVLKVNEGYQKAIGNR